MLAPLVRAAVCAFALSCVAQARPIVIENGFTLTPPAGFQFTDVLALPAIDGNWALVPALQANVETPSSVQLLYRRVGGVWVFDRVLDEWADPWSSGSGYDGVKMKNGIAVVMRDELRIYERSGTTWTRAPVADSTTAAPLAFDGHRLLTSRGDTCEWDGDVYQRGATAWTVTGQLEGNYIGCDNPNQITNGLDRAIGGDIAVIDNPWGESQEYQSFQMHVYRADAAGRWAPDGVLYSTGSLETSPNFAFGAGVHAGNVLVGGEGGNGTLVFSPGTGGWTHTGHILTTDNFDSPGYADPPITDGGLLVRNQFNPARGNYSARVFRRNADGHYEYVAEIVARNGRELLARDLSGRRVITQVRAPDGAIGHTIYELPASFETAPTLQDDFEAGNGTAWTALPGSQWSVQPSGATHVYNQASTAGDAGAILTGSDRADQVVQADVRVRAFDGGDRWFGLVTRYSNAGDHYYVTVRSSNRVDLKRVVNGSFTTLASAPLAVATGRNFRVTLESAGTAHRVYVDGKQLLVAYDAALTHGSAGIRMYRTNADYDNVVVSAGPYTSIHSNGAGWVSYLKAGGTWSDGRTQPVTISQSATDGDARLLAGAPDTTDQTVQARARLDAFGPAAPGGQHWYGLFARYVDARTHYYLTVRSSNLLQIRKQVNGVVTVLASRPFTVNANPRVLRLDAVGDRLRAFVDGTPALEVRDASIPSGRVGIGGYRTKASFGEIISYQP